MQPKGHAPIGIGKRQQRINEYLFCNTVNPDSKNILYGDKSTIYKHKCKPPICPTCGKLILRQITEKEKATRWSTYIGRSTPRSDIVWSVPTNPGIKG